MALIQHTHSSPPPQQQQQTQQQAMRLEGHRGEVFSVRFSPSGDVLASSSLDGDILLWDMRDRCENFLALRGGHVSAVLSVDWACGGGGGGGALFSGGADATIALWDVAGGDLLRHFDGHRAAVNAVAASRTHPALVASASNDRTARLWDARAGSRDRGAAILPHAVQATAVAVGGGCSGGDDALFTGSLDGCVRQWDLRAPDAPLRVLRGHTDVVTALCLSRAGDGAFLASNGADGHVRVWDVRPYVRPELEQNRCVKIMAGHVHDAFERTLIRCSWSHDGKMLASGSADGVAVVWSTTSRAVLHRLAGHTGSVNDVQFHPTLPIVASCSSDKSIIVGELPPSA